jgi:hypothetical protein
VQRGRERIYPSYFQMAKVELEEEFSEVVRQQSCDKWFLEALRDTRDTTKA